MALGARRDQLILWLLRHGAVPLAAGIGAGLLAAAALRAWAAGLLYELPGGGLPILAGAAAVLLGVGLIALLVPTSRAVRAGPLPALRGR